MSLPSSKPPCSNYVDVIPSVTHRTLPSISSVIKNNRKRVPVPLVLGSIDEETTSESSEYYLDLGAESPCSSPPNLFETSEFVEQWAAAGVAVPRLTRRPPRRAFNNLGGKEKERSKSSHNKDAIDRDCGICFEYAVVPCRTLCCGKIFCSEHLEDWLHGPNAEGRCPNCENACSLEGGTLSLATPSLSRSPPKNKRTALKPNVYSSSPLSALQPHTNDTLGWKSMPSSKKTASLTDSTESSSTTDSVVTSTSSETEPSIKRPEDSMSTTPFATSWGAMSRLMSIVTFLMFIYKILS